MKHIPRVTPVGYIWCEASQGTSTGTVHGSKEPWFGLIPNIVGKGFKFPTIGSYCHFLGLSDSQWIYLENFTIAGFLTCYLIKFSLEKTQRHIYQKS